MDAAEPIRKFLTRHVRKDFLLDHIHPNASLGVLVYSNAVLFGPREAWGIE